MKHQPAFLRNALLCLCMMIASAVVYAQKPVKGRIVSGEDQKPIAGATVKVKGSNSLITSTDEDGAFAINAKENDVLVITTIGFASREVKATASLNNIILATDARNLNEVVVTALGIKKDAKRVGYSVQEVKGSDLLKARESNPINSLVGKVAGLNVGINAEILASPTVLLRGVPLTFYVVDGIPINSDT